MNPACPREKSPVKPFKRFILTATRAYTAPFLRVVKTIMLRLGSRVFSSTMTRASTAATPASERNAPLLLFFSSVAAGMAHLLRPCR